jgi:hypothetical protein
MACVLLVGGLFFRDTHLGGYFVPSVAFFGGLILLDVLDTRDWRRKEKEVEPPPPTG